MSKGWWEGRGKIVSERERERERKEDRDEGKTGRQAGMQAGRGSERTKSDGMREREGTRGS